MSRASKITLGVTSVACAVTVVWVHYVQGAERALLHEGPKKDERRMKEKLNRLEQTSSQKQNEQEHKMQLELKRRYESVQPLGAVVPSEAEKKT